MIPTQREYLDGQFLEALDCWRTSHGRARGNARHELHGVIEDLRKELERADRSFRAAVARSKERRGMT